MPIRLGIVGADEPAREIVDVLMSIDDARIVAVCDRDTARAESLARRCKARAFASARAMLKPPPKPKRATTENRDETKTLDAVCVMSNERNRGEAISLAMGSGCDVFLASPLAFSVDGAKQLVQTAHDNRARLWTSHAIRFSSSAQSARKTLQSRGAGVVGFHGAWKIEVAASSPKAARDVQCLTSSTRCVDALRFLNGEVKGVYARSSNGNIAMSIEFQSGVVGAILLGESCENSLHFVTRNGFLEWRETAVTTRRDNETQHIEYSNDAARNELRAWLQSVESGRRTLAKSKLEDAICNLRVALAIAQSIKTNKPVRLGG